MPSKNVVIFQSIALWSGGATAAILIAKCIKALLRSSEKLPFPGPKGLPLIGTAFQLSPDTAVRKMTMWCDMYGGTCAFWVFSTPFIVTSDLQIIKHIMLETPKVYSYEISNNGIMKDLGTDCLFTSDGDNWKTHRRATVPAFNAKNVDAMLSTISVVAGRLVKEVQKGGERKGSKAVEFDALYWFRLATLDVIFAISQGKDWNLLNIENPKSNEVVKMVNELLDGFAFLMMSSGMAPLIRNRFPWNLNPRVRKAYARVTKGIDFTREVVEKRKSEIEAGRKPKENILDKLILSGSHEVEGDLIGFIAGGSETVATSLAWLTFMFCKYPEIQAKARTEVMSLGYDPVTSDDLTKLPYIEACVLENIRVQPVDQSFPRINLKSTTKFRGKDIPAGAVVIMLIGHALIQPCCGGREFRPERWLGMDGRVDVKLLSDIPIFGIGPRSCPGQLLAVKQIMIIISTLLRHSKIMRIDANAVVGTKVDITRTPTNLYVELDFE